MRALLSYTRDRADMLRIRPNLVEHFGEALVAEAIEKRLIAEAGPVPGWSGDVKYFAPTLAGAAILERPMTYLYLGHKYKTLRGLTAAMVKRWERPGTVTVNAHKASVTFTTDGGHKVHFAALVSEDDSRFMISAWPENSMPG